MTYSDKLKDPRWQRKRLEILQRDDFTCQCCGDKETELHVHHKKYNGEPYQAKMSDLITLCKICHKDTEILKKLDFELKKRLILELGNESVFIDYTVEHGNSKALFITHYMGDMANNTLIFKSESVDKLLSFLTLMNKK